MEAWLCPLPRSFTPEPFVPRPILAGGHRMTLFAWARRRRFPRLPAAEARLLPRRSRHRSARPLPLAAGADARAHRHPAARPRRVERRPLHARPRRQGVGPRLQRRAAQPAQLRRHRAPDARALSLGAHRRSARGDADAGRRRPAALRLRRLLAGRQPGAEARRRAEAPTAAASSPSPRCRRRSSWARASMRSSAATTSPTTGTSCAGCAGGCGARRGSFPARGTPRRCAASVPCGPSTTPTPRRTTALPARPTTTTAPAPGGCSTAWPSRRCSSPPTTTRSCRRRRRATRCWRPCRSSRVWSPRHGGHCGYVGRPAFADDDGYWAERQVIASSPRTTERVTVRPGRGSGQQLQHALAERRALAGVLVLEVHEHVAAAWSTGPGPPPSTAGWRRRRSPRRAAADRRSRRWPSPASTAPRCRRCTARGCGRAGARRPRRSATSRGGTRRRPTSPSGTVARKASNTSRLHLRFGGVWKSTAPSCGPSSRAVFTKKSTLSPTSFRRRSWVMRRLALRVKRKAGGTCAAQPATTLGVGIR